MTVSPKIVLSASRRTDIPAFYLDWFMGGIDQGWFDVTNPYTRKSRKVIVNQDNVHSIVFWSKNYAEFITSHSGEQLSDQGYNLHFNFTINSDSTVLEPDIPDLSTRLKQLETLCNNFSPEAVAWRFDPLCFFTSDESTEQNNLSDFITIAKFASGLGIRKCVTSFFDPYKKIELRLGRLFKKKGKKLVFKSLSTKKQKDTISSLASQAEPYGITLHLCCEKQLFESLELGTNIFENACIDGRILKKLYGGNPETKRDYSQRSGQGCQCTKAVDIGSYNLHPCLHNCLYCYANPEIDKKHN